MFQHIMSYVQMVENKKHEISNVMQTKYWQDKKARLSGNELLLPLALYQDEVETNNALGSHRGRGKVGAVYVVLPFFPPPPPPPLDLKDRKHFSCNFIQFV